MIESLLHKGYSQNIEGTKITISAAELILMFCPSANLNNTVGGIWALIIQVCNVKSNLILCMLIRNKNLGYGQ